MSDYPTAKLAYLTHPEKGEVVLNLQTEGQDIQRFKLTRDHLFNLNSQTADILMRECQ